MVLLCACTVLCCGFWWITMLAAAFAEANIAAGDQLIQSHGLLAVRRGGLVVSSLAWAFAIAGRRRISVALASLPLIACAVILFLHSATG